VLGQLQVGHGTPAHCSAKAKTVGQESLVVHPPSMALGNREQAAHRRPADPMTAATGHAHHQHQHRPEVPPRAAHLRGTTPTRGVMPMLE
jgi:hypothetical protein